MSSFARCSFMVNTNECQLESRGEEDKRLKLKKWWPGPCNREAQVITDVLWHTHKVLGPRWRASADDSTPTCRSLLTRSVKQELHSCIVPISYTQWRLNWWSVSQQENTIACSFPNLLVLTNSSTQWLQNYFIRLNKLGIMLWEGTSSPYGSPADSERGSQQGQPSVVLS